MVSGIYHTVKKIKIEKRGYMDELKWLQEWYQSNCDGDWEHMFGVKINTLDNPGWMVDISLSDTVFNLEDCVFEKINIERSETDWIMCYVENEVFKGYGGTQNLSEIISVFRDFVAYAESICVD